MRDRDKVLAYSRKYHIEHREQERTRNNIRHRAQRIECIDHYGGKCACCGETEIEFLVIDHINGGGTQHRKEIGKGDKIYRWLRKNNFPEGLRVLCANCNQSYGHYGFCPHNGE